MEVNKTELPQFLEVLGEVYKAGFIKGYIMAADDGEWNEKEFEKWGISDILTEGIEKTKKEWIKKYNLK